MAFEKGSVRNIEECNVLIVDDQASSRMIMTSLLEDIAHIHTVESATQAKQFCLLNNIDLVVSDVYMPEMDGHQLCRELQNDPITHQLPVMFVTASDSDEEQEACWESGCVDFVTKPINATTFRNRVKAQLSHKLKADLLETLIYTDRLTGAFNRHYLDERLTNIVKEADREGHSIAAAMFDIDFFKQYNDEYGHISGDSCLWKLSSAVRQVLLRPMDHLIRVGGEEFLVLLPNTTEKGAEIVCQRILKAVRDLSLPHIRSPFKKVTVSVGVSVYQPNQQQSMEQIMLEADQCLYKAKNQGRNQFIRSRNAEHSNLMD